MALRFDSIRLPGDGLMLAADAIGDPDAPPVLFFHGGGQSRSSWRGAARRVAEAGYRAYTVDLRGHGDSDWAKDGDYLLDALPVTSSMSWRRLGARQRSSARRVADRPCWSAVRAVPDRISLIMLADVAPMIADTGVGRIRNFFQRSLAGFASAEEAAGVLAGLLDRPQPTDVAGLRKAMRVDHSGRLFWRWDPLTVSPEFLNPPSETTAVEVAAASVPRAHSARPGRVQRRGGQCWHERFRQLTPHLVVVEAKGVGHMYTGDRNDVFAATLLDHLARCAPLVG
ncbi:MAG: alpha/beta hydrolase [Aliidongia sp.]